MSEVKANVALDKEFFAKAETNCRTDRGLSRPAHGERPGLERLALRADDRHQLDPEGHRRGRPADRRQARPLIGDDEYRLAFYAQSNELPPRDELAKIARLLAPMPRGGETFAIQVIGRRRRHPWTAELAPLAAISVKKIAN